MANIDSKGKEIVSIVAMGSNNVIGDSNHNEMPWRLPMYADDSFLNNEFRKADMNLFKEITANGYVIVGVHTADSMGGYFPLPYKVSKEDEGFPRRSVLLSRRSKEDLVNLYNFNPKRDFPLHSSLEDAIINVPDEAARIVLAGGRRVYEEGLKYVDRLIVSRLNQEFEGDVFFPDMGFDFVLNSIETPFSETEYAGRHSIITYVRRGW